MSIARLMQMARAGVPSGPVWTDPDLANASYDSVSFSVAGQDATPSDLDFNDNGTKLFVLGFSGKDVNEYALSSAYDISTASFSQNTAVTGTNVYGMFFREDGLKLYGVGLAGFVYQHSLSTAWDISTLTYDSVSYDATSKVSSLRDIWIKPDGTKMYLVDASGDDINEYTLSTAWDVSSASYVQNFSLASQDNIPIGVYFNPDGTKFWVYGFTSDTAYEYDLTTAWDLSSASYSTVSFSAASQVAFGLGMTFARDGSKMYVSDNTGDTIYQYSTVTPAAPSWTDPDLANASYDSVSFSVAGEEPNPTSLSFSSDGTKVYTVGTVNDTVIEYALSTAWDISTASYQQGFSVNTQDIAPVGLFFKPDGSKFYIAGNATDSIYEYNLSSSWDISSATYVQSFGVSSQDTIPQGVFFKSDGSKMFVAGTSNDSIYEYSLSVAWDISTASYVQGFSVASEDTSPSDLFFSPSGDVLFITGTTGDSVYEYALSTAWDISSASYSSVSFSVASQASIPQGIFFKSDGSKMYVSDSVTDTIYQYST